MKTFCQRLRAAALLLPFTAPALAASTTIPAVQGTALDGHSVSLPRDLHSSATILILGFSQHSADPTTAWEKPVHTSLAGPRIHFYDMPFLEDAPGFIRPLIVRSIRKQVPDTLKPNFVPITSGQAAWKQVAGFSPADPDAAYVLLVDSTGHVLWQTHQPYSPELFDQLAHAARALDADPGR